MGDPCEQPCGRPGEPGWRHWLALTLGLILLKAVLLLADHHPMLFLGDSMSYLWTAVSGWIPRDRSFTYGFFIHAVTGPWASLQPLLAAQTLCGAATCLAGAWLLVRGLGVRWPLAFTLALLGTVEPFMLAYERYVMTECLSLFLFAAHLVLVTEYLCRPRLGRLVLIQLAAIATVSLRASYLPLLYANTLLVPLLGTVVWRGGAGPGGWRRWLRPAGHLACSLAAAALLNFGYRAAGVALDEERPLALQPESGLFQVAIVAPLVEPQDFPDPELGRRVLAGLTLTKSDPEARNAHRWGNGGLVDVLRRETGTPAAAERAGRIAARNAIRRDPVGFVRLALWTAGGFFRDPYAAQQLRTDRCPRPLPADAMRVLSRRFGYTDARAPIETASLAQELFGRVVPYARYLWFTPLLFLAAFGLTRGRARSLVVILGSGAVLTLAVAAFLSGRAVFRYLHPLGWLALLAWGPLLEAVSRRCRARRPSSSES